MQVGIPGSDGKEAGRHGKKRRKAQKLNRARGIWRVGRNLQEERKVHKIKRRRSPRSKDNPQRSIRDLHVNLNWK